MGQIACIPMGDMSPAERRMFHVRAWRAFEDKASKELGMAKSAMTIRDAILGESTTPSPDWYDLKTKTYQVAKQEFWAQDAADLTAYTLGNTLDTTYVLPTATACAIYGFVDLSTTKDLTGINYFRGAESLLFIEPEKCYGDPNAPDGGFLVDTNDETGMTPALMFWKQNDNVQIKHNFKAAADRFVVHLAIWAESAGKRQKGITPVCSAA